MLHRSNRGLPRLSLQFSDSPFVHEGSVVEAFDRHRASLCWPRVMRGKAASLLHFEDRSEARCGAIALIDRPWSGSRPSTAWLRREKNHAKWLTQKKCVASFRRNASQRTTSDPNEFASALHRRRSRPHGSSPGRADRLPPAFPEPCFPPIRRDRPVPAALLCASPSGDALDPRRR